MHLYRSFLAAAPVLLGLAGCEAQSDKPNAPPAAPAGTPPAAATPVTSPTSAAKQPLGSVATLAGEWRVAGIDDTPFDESYGIALSTDKDVLWWEPRCAQRARRYVIQGSAITFSRPAEGIKAPACVSGAPTRLRDVERALDAATAIGRTSSNGILLSGGGHSLLLFSQ